MYMQTQFHDYLSWYMGSVPHTEESDTLPKLQCRYRAVTISRLYGCEALEIARLLCDKLNEQRDKDTPKWIVLDREILHRVASELNVSSLKLNELKPAFHRGFIESVKKAFDKDYNNMDNNMVTALHTVVGAYLTRGNVIIVGRGAAVFTKHVPEVLNVKLIGNLGYRISTISNKKFLGYDEAEYVVTSMDKKRKQFLELLSYEAGKPRFDVTIDREKISTNVIVSLLKEAVVSMPVGTMELSNKEE